MTVYSQHWESGHRRTRKFRAIPSHMLSENEDLTSLIWLRRRFHGRYPGEHIQRHLEGSRLNQTMGVRRKRRKARKNRESPWEPRESLWTKGVPKCRSYIGKRTWAKGAEGQALGWRGLG